MNLLSHSLISVYICFCFLHSLPFRYIIRTPFACCTAFPLPAPLCTVQCEDVRSINCPGQTIFSDTVQGQYPVAFSLMLNLWVAEQGESSFFLMFFFGICILLDYSFIVQSLFFTKRPTSFNTLPKIRGTFLSSHIFDTIKPLRPQSKLNLNYCLTQN